MPVLQLTPFLDWCCYLSQFEEGCQGLAVSVYCHPKVGKLCIHTYIFLFFKPLRQQKAGGRGVRWAELHLVIDSVM